MPVDYTTITDLSRKFEKQIADRGYEIRVLNQGWNIHEIFLKNPRLSYKQVSQELAKTKSVVDKNGKPLDRRVVWEIYDKFLKIMQKEGFDVTVK